MAKSNGSLTAERLRKLLNYDQDTGIFIWKVSRNGVRPGRQYRRPDGYLQKTVDRKNYLVHRLVWLYVTGKWPDEIDHIDGDRTNNRFANLRDISSSGNKQNKKRAQRNNRSTGLLGVSFDVRYRKPFRARIAINGVQKTIGRFSTAEEAHEAYLAEKRVIHPFGTL